MGEDDKEEEKADLRSFLEGKEEKKLRPAGDRLRTFVLFPVKT